MTRTIVPITISYLLGSIPFALIVARFSGVPDLRRIGSGNLGATNVWRAAGPRAALWVFAGDIGKGVAAMLLARLILGGPAATPDRDLILILCAIAAVLGHVFPFYLGFRGGKGVNTALGVMIVLLPLPTLVALAAFLVTVTISRYISLGSIVASLVLPAAVAAQQLVSDQPAAPAFLWLTLVLAVLVVAAHRANIGRLLAGKESRFSFRSKAVGGGHDG